MLFVLLNQRKTQNKRALEFLLSGTIAPLQLVILHYEDDASILFQPVKIGRLEVKNRFVKSATAETMADAHGGVTEPLLNFHVRLAEGGVGLQVLGHSYVCESGKAVGNGQTSLSEDSSVPGLTRLTEAVHRAGGKIFAQLNHAGSYSTVSDRQPVAPSSVQNPITGKIPQELRNDEIRDIIDSFGDAAARAKRAGFDGVDLHGGHGYLIGAFCSHYLNRREDQWGGSAGNRGRFLIEVFSRLREQVGNQFPITLKMGMEDNVDNGLGIEESCQRAKRLEDMGLNAITVSCGVTTRERGTTRKYVAVSGSRALKDLLFHRVFAQPVGEAYFAPYASKLQRVLNIPIMLEGGVRSTDMMVKVVKDGIADFIRMGRPFIREPDIVSQIRNGRRGLVDCTSCSLCGMHSGKDPVRCWRANPAWLLLHATLRLTRAFKS